MKIGIPKEIHSGEKRVATTPTVAEQIIKLGFEVNIESGAGLQAHFSDEAYKEAGCTIRKNAKTLWKNADIILKVRPPEIHPQFSILETELLSKDSYLISFIWPAQNAELMQNLAATEATVLAMDGTEIKIIVRSNPGLVLLKKGSIVDKWGSRSIPEFEDIIEKQNVDLFEGVRQALNEVHGAYAIVIISKENNRELINN